MQKVVLMAALLVVVAVVPGGPVVEPAEGTWTGTSLLRTFELGEFVFEEHFFVLKYWKKDGEHFDRYLLMFERNSGPAVAGGAGMVHVRVNLIDGLNPPAERVVCAGIITETPLLPFRMHCDNLAPGHHYRIEAVSTVPATLQLYGYDRLVQPAIPTPPVCLTGIC